MQRLLDRRPGLDVAVLAVWVATASGEARSFWDADLLDDERVRHYWDGGRSIGEFFGERDGLGFTYDVYYAYGPDGPLRAQPVESGRPVVTEIEPLERALERSAA